MRIVISRPIPQTGIDKLRSAGFEVTVSPNDRPMTPAELASAVADADGLVTMLNDKIDAALLAHAPKLKAIAQYAVGFNNIDVPACTAKKIGVANTPDVLTNATAEVAWTLLMMAARRGGEGERAMRAKVWDGWGPLQFLGVDIVGKTLGLIGAGRIGLRVAKMAAGFDMKVLYNNRKPSPEMDALGATFTPFETLIKTSDFISLHAPLTPQTKHLIGAPQFAMMKPTTVLINTARGPIIDEAALVHALKTKQLFAAGLDVFEHEPTLHPGLYELENAILLPHIGSATIDTRNTMSNLVADNLIAMLTNKRPPTPVNPELWA